MLIFSEQLLNYSKLLRVETTISTIDVAAGARNGMVMTHVETGNVQLIIATCNKYN